MSMSSPPGVRLHSDRMPDEASAQFDVPPALTPAPEVAASGDHSVIDPSILYVGTPVVLISTRNSNGTTNLAPMSSAWWLGHTGVLGLGLTSHTAANLLRTRQCVLNLPDERHVGAVDKLALTTGARDVPEWKAARGYRHVEDKFRHAGLNPVPSDVVEPPRAAECPIALEAELLACHTTDFHLITVDVTRVHVHGDIRASQHEDRIDPERWRPLIMSFQRFYGLGGEVHSSRLATIPEEAYR